MRIVFQSDRVEKLFLSDRELARRYGDAQTKRIRLRMIQLNAATNLSEISTVGSIRCEELKSDRQGQLSVRLFAGERLIFEPANDPVPRKADGGLDWVQVTEIRIIEVVNYHD